MGAQLKRNLPPPFQPGTILRAPSVVLANPKYAHNVGQTLRMAACYAVGQVWCSGERILQEVSFLGRLPREERMKGYADVEIAWHEDPLSALEPGAVPVAVEFRPHAEPLYDFVHPENAVYVFGPEDGSLDRSILTRCHRFVVMDTAHCMNLATAVATVLYDRSLKARL